MKRLGIVLLLLLFSTAAYADFKFEMTGDMKASGTYYQNHDLASEDTASHAYYDGDLNLFPKIIVGDSSVNLAVAIRDETWRYGTADADDTSELDNNIAIERCWLQHKFNDKTTLDVGLMDGGTWGTTFADDKSARYRVKVTHKTDVGIVLALLEKMSEVGATATSVEDAEKDDWDDYAVGFVTKVDKIKIAPLFYYCDISSAVLDQDSDGLKRLYLALEVSGDLDVIAFETELGYNNYNADYDGGEDWTTMGFYLNVWKAMDAATVGGMLAYGSFDKDVQAGFDFDDDFDSTVILGDELGIGGGDDLLGMSLIKIYANGIKTGNESLSFGGYLAYIMSNHEDNDYEDASAFELGVDGTYDITENLYYNAGLAYASISTDVDGVDDPDPIYTLYHTIKLTF